MQAPDVNLSTAIFYRVPKHVPWYLYKLVWEAIILHDLKESLKKKT